MSKIFKTFANALCRYETDTISVWDDEVIANNCKLGTTYYFEL